MTTTWFPVDDSVKRSLELAIENWENSTVADQYIDQAIASAQDQPDVLIAAYRYFFYKNNNRMALHIADRVMAHVRRSEQLPDEWEHLQPILAERWNDPPIRLFLNAYAAAGFLYARLGELEIAKEISSRVKAIHEKEFGAAVVFDVLTKPDDDDD